MPSPVADPKINGSYVPRHWLSDGDYAFFVEGYTGDNLKDWIFKVAPLVDGKPNMQEADQFWRVVASWPKLDENYGDRTMMQLAELTLLVGNTQRKCQGLPTL